jgi:hypothetical protein
MPDMRKKARPNQGENISTQNQEPRRGHAQLKYNKEIAEQFGIEPGADPPRELVKVASIPVPPDVDEPEAPALWKTVDAGTEDRLVLVLKEEMDELEVRLARFGVAFTGSQKQDVVDYTMSRLMGYGGGGAIARRQ